MKRKWTQEERDQLLLLYPDTSMNELIDIFKRTSSSIQNQAFILGVKRSMTFIVETSRKNSENQSEAAIASQFKKGHKPHNVGKKQTEYMSTEQFEKSKATCFKKGNVPPNAQPVGSKIFTKNRYIRIKIAEPNKWELLHRYTWMQYHGAIPKGHNVQFKDGNRQNCDIDNLYLITRNQQMLDNSATLNLPDKIIAIYLAGSRGCNKELVKELLKHKDLLELKRNQLILKRTIKNETDRSTNM